MDCARIKELFGIDADCGFSNDDLRPWAERFGAIPSTLRDYYLTLGRHQKLNQTQDALVLPDGCQVGYYHFSDFADADGYLVFYSENQGVTLWAVAAADVTLPDPPVWATQPVSDGDYGEWYDTGDSVSQFLLAMAYMQRAMSYEFSSEEIWDLTLSQAEQVRRRYPSHQADANLYNGVTFHGRDLQEVIMLNQGEGRVYTWFGASDEGRYEELADRLRAITAGED